MQLITLDEGDLEMLGQQSAHGGLATAADAHHHHMRHAPTGHQPRRSPEVASKTCDLATSCSRNTWSPGSAWVRPCSTTTI
ncbi:MAG: hypothetical protein ACK55I_37775, partial [bacterium]